MDPSDLHLAACRADRRLAWWRGRTGRGAFSTGVTVCVLATLSVTALLAWLRYAGSEPALPSGDPPLRVVSVTKPGYTDGVTLTLPANVDAYQTTLLYSRIDGYLLRWDTAHADIGCRVKKGDKLAEIDTPELDQQLIQAKANLVQGQADLDTAIAEREEAKAALEQADADTARAKANVEFARSVQGRNEQLSAKHMIAGQDLDESHRDVGARQADLDAALAAHKTRASSILTCTARIKSREATIKSLEASVRRLEELQGFKTIVAPFDGIVTRRRAEVGSLIAAGSMNCPELFAVAQADILRIRINVPQAQAMAIKMGQSAEVRVAEYPERVFTATVARTSRAIDSVSRTLMVELELANPDQALLPGTFAQVTLPVRRLEPMCTVPSSVLLNQPDGLKVAILEVGNMVRLQKVQLGRDFGSSVEVLGGLRGGERLVFNPPDDLADREKVTIAASSGGPDAQGAAEVAAHDEPKSR